MKSSNSKVQTVEFKSLAKNRCFCSFCFRHYGSQQRRRVGGAVNTLKKSLVLTGRGTALQTLLGAAPGRDPVHLDR